MLRDLVLLFACGVSLIGVSAQHTYESQPALYKDAISRAIEEANKKTKFHVNFYGILRSEVTPTSCVLTFHLRPTVCAKEKDEHRKECNFRSNRPLINCVVCGGRSGDTVQEPFVDCISQQEISKTVEDYREQKCSFDKSPVAPGSTHLLSLKTSDDVFLNECLGCF